MLERKGKGSLQYLANIVDDTVHEFFSQLSRVLWLGASHKHKSYVSVLAGSHSKHPTAVHQVDEIIGGRE